MTLALVKIKIYKFSVEHKVVMEHVFPVRGHSYMPADQDFLDRRLTDKTIKKVMLFSDSCTVLGVLAKLSVEHNVTMEHVFPVRGHSYMPANRALAGWSES